MGSLKKSWESQQEKVSESHMPAANVIESREAIIEGKTLPTEYQDDGVLDGDAIGRLEELSGGDKSFLVDFINTFLENVPEMFEELQHSCEKGDAETLRRVAHTLKSNSASLGAMQLRDICKELEGMGKNEKLGGSS